MRREAGIFLLVAGALVASPGHGQSIDAVALKEISDFAKDFCGEYATGGSRENLQLEGSAKAELDGFLKKLTDIGVEGAAQFDTGEYVGVLQQELRGELQSVRDCRLKIWSDLKAGVVEAAPAPAAPAPAATPEPAVAPEPAAVAPEPVFAPEPLPQTGYLYPFTATTPLGPADLAAYGSSDLEVMRNEIYARYGYAFRRADLQALFAGQSWYRPVTSDPEAAWRSMTPLEQANVIAIKAEEARR